MAGRKGSIALVLGSWRCVLALCAILCLIGTAEAQPSRYYDIDLPARGGMADALNGLSEQTRVPVVFPYDLVRDLTANPVVGHYTLQEALQVLLKGTGLSGGLSEKGVLTISQRKSGNNDKRENTVTSETSSPERKSTRAHRAGIAGFFAAVGAAFSASAQDGIETSAAAPSDTGYVEVKVTARKREERVQDVPASVMAASAQTLSDLNVVSMTELHTIAPGLTFVTDPGRFGSGPAIALRGISTLTQSPAVQDSVGIVLDGIPISYAKAGAFPDLSDVAHVEALPGPQGTLFGKNATAGVISISTKDPSRVFEAQGEVDYSRYNDIRTSAAISGPIAGETLLGRLSVYYKSRDGYIENLYDGSKWDNDRQKGARGKLVFMPTPDDTLKLSGDFLQENNDAGMQTIRAFLPTTPAYIRAAIAPIVWTDNDKVDANSLGSNTQRVGGGALQWDHAIGSNTLTAISGYRFWTQNSDSGTYNWPTLLNGAPGNGGNTYFKVDSRQYSGELRIASPSDRTIDYVTGLFVFHNDISSSLFDPLPGLLALSANGTLTGRQQRNWTNDTKTLNYAAFGELNTHFTRQLTLTTGLRWTHEKDDAQIVGLPTEPGLQRLVVPLGTTEASQTASAVSWRAGLQWRFDEDKMLYVSASTGWKGPGFNVVSSIPGNSQPVNPETSLSYEAGWKSQFFRRRLTVDFDVYRATYKDYQTQGFVTLPGTQVATVVIANAAKLQTRGFEGQLAASITDSTQISVNGTYIDATFDEFHNAQCYTGQPVGPGQCVAGEQDLSGKRLANTPKWAYNVLAKQDFNIPGGSWTGFLTLDYSWHSNIEWDVLGSPYGVEPSYGLLGASIGVQTKDSRAGLKLYGKNLTNTFHTEGILIGQTVSQFLPVDYRRVLGAEVFFKF